MVVFRQNLLQLFLLTIYVKGAFWNFEFQNTAVVKQSATVHGPLVRNKPHMLNFQQTLREEIHLQAVGQ